jgi:hypothetical protein
MEAPRLWQWVFCRSGVLVQWKSRTVGGVCDGLERDEPFVYLVPKISFLVPNFHWKGMRVAPTEDRSRQIDITPSQ